MVGHMMEYLVAFLSMHKYSGTQAANLINASRESAYDYFEGNDSTSVFIPDHICGPDITYKCGATRTVYIVQVKFV